MRFECTIMPVLLPWNSTPTFALAPTPRLINTVNHWSSTYYARFSFYYSRWHFGFHVARRGAGRFLRGNRMRSNPIHDQWAFPPFRVYLMTTPTLLVASLLGTFYHTSVRQRWSESGFQESNPAGFYKKLGFRIGSGAQFFKIIKIRKILLVSILL